MIVRSSFVALALLACAPAYGAADTRIRTEAYSPNQIVRILGKAGIQSTIEFADDERIENVAVGDSAAWQITPNHRASLLFVKPLTPRSRTNMTVVTDHRTYMFDLVAGDKWTTPLYALKFSYPNEKSADLAKPVEQAAVVAAPPVSPTVTAEKLHFDWNTKGNGKLLPARVFDDGSALYLSWNHDAPLPAILTMSEDRKEGPLNYRMDGDYIVIDPIPQNVVLRYGSRTAALWPSHRIPSPQPNAIAGRMAGNPAPPPKHVMSQPPSSIPATSQAASAPRANSKPALRVADLTALYSDKLTDTAHDQ